MRFTSFSASYGPHLAYAHMVDYFVSDDKFYKKFKNNEILKVNFIKFDEYNEICK
jgi:hypothetical protein